MPAPRDRRRTSGPAALVTAAVLAAGALSGCSVRSEAPGTSASSGTPSSAPATETSSPSATSSPPSAPPSPSQTAGETTPPSPSPTPTADSPPATALLGPREMPQLNDTLRWRVVGDGPLDSRPFGVCQRFDLLTLGAERGAQRIFAADGSSAGQQVVDFPDAQNAVRARKVLEAFHRDCARTVRGRRVVVSALTKVPVPVGQGWWYLVRYVRGGVGRFESFGAVLSGARMSLVRVDHAGEDHDYPTGRDPGELAVQAAARLLR